jgi:hypothetical protein
LQIFSQKIDWKKALEDCDYFHWTGISPGISKSAYESLKEGLQTARELGIELRPIRLTVPIFGNTEKTETKY